MSSKVRLHFTKVGKIRWTSHRDIARMFERALRRTNLPVAYTEGFSPRPKLSFGLALPTGAESQAEFIDIDFAAEVDADSLPGLLSPALPNGIDVVAAVALGERVLSLQHEVTSCRWELELVGVEPQAADAIVQRALAADTLVVTRERKGQQVDGDLRPGILALAVVGPIDDGTLVEAELACQPRTVRPAELLTALGLEPGDARVRRTHQWIQREEGSRIEPLDASAAPPAPLERVS